MDEEAFAGLVKAISELNFDDSLKTVRKKLEVGVPAKDILSEGLMRGLKEIGSRFERGEYFLSDLVFAATIMGDAMEILSPYLAKEVGKVSSLGRVVIGTVAGDIHDLGKNIVVNLMKGSRFEVYDLGVDVAAEKFVDKVKEVDANIVGMSALLSTTAPYFKNVVDALKVARLRDRLLVLIGGPPLITAEEVGADYYCKDAFTGVELASKYMETRKKY